MSFIPKFQGYIIRTIFMHPSYTFIYLVVVVHSFHTDCSRINYQIVSLVAFYLSFFSLRPFRNLPLEITKVVIVINICLGIQILDNGIDGIDIVALQLLFALRITHRDNQMLGNGCLCICTFFESNICNKLWHIIFPVPCCGIAVSCYLIDIITLFIFLCCSFILLIIFFDIGSSWSTGKDSCIGIIIDELPLYFFDFVILHRRRDV